MSQKWVQPINQIFSTAINLNRDQTGYETFDENEPGADASFLQQKNLIYLQADKEAYFHTTKLSLLTVIIT